jgi:hypothetical protein
MLLTFIPPSFFIIGKSDPDGTKAGDAVDIDVVNRLIVFLNGHYPGAYPEDKMIECLRDHSLAGKKLFYSLLCCSIRME